MHSSWCGPTGPWNSARQILSWESFLEFSNLNSEGTHGMNSGENSNSWNSDSLGMCCGGCCVEVDCVGIGLMRL